MRFKSLFSQGAKPITALSDAQIAHMDDVQEWAEIYQGGAPWQYVRKGGLEGGMRKLNALNAAKALCMELSALCFSQQMDISVGNEKMRQYAEQILQENSFWSCFPLFLEKMFAYGAGVIKVYTENNRPKLDFLGADCFVPTQYDEKQVYGGIIISRRNESGVDYILLEEHKRDGKEYVICNKLYRNNHGSWRETELSELYPELAEETRVEGLSKPLFVYFRPAGAGDNALGISVFESALDTLKSLDIVFDSLEREFVLGKKRIIVPCSAIRGEYDRKGNLIKYFDTSDEVYQALSADDNDELKIVDNSTELRVEQHKAALEELLDLLCMQVGLSQGTLSYHSDTAKTATEVISRNSKTYRTKTAHQQLIREGLISVIDNILLLGMVCGEIPCGEHKTVVVFSDSVAQDNTQKIDNAVKLFNAGIIDRDRAIMEIYGLDKSEVMRGGV